MCKSLGVFLPTSSAHPNLRIIRRGVLPFGIVKMKKRDNRNGHLRAAAVDWALAIKRLDSRAARWIANDALKELQKKTSWLSDATHKAECHRLYSCVLNQILLHAPEKGEQLSLLLGCHPADAVPDVDEQVRNPGKQVLVTCDM